MSMKIKIKIRKLIHVYFQLYLLLWGITVHAALPQPILQYNFDENIVTTSYPCGQPDYNARTAALLIVWEDCNTGLWHLRATAGGDFAHYTGSIISNKPFSLVRGISIERHDNINTSNPNRIDFSLKTWGGGQDGIMFSFPQDTEVTLELTDTSNVSIGKNLENIKTPVSIAGGSTTPPAMTNIIIDSSGKNLHAVLSESDNHGMPTSVSGHTGSAMHFNRSALINVGDHNKLDLAEFTITAWVKYQHYSGDGRQEILEKADSYWMNIRQDTHRIRVGGIFGACNGTERQWIFVDSVNSVPENTWTHTVASYNGSFLRVYINGQLEGQVAVSKPLCDNDQPLIIGAKYLLQTLDNEERNLDPPEAFFNGSIDSVHIFDRALSGTEIWEAMNQ